MKMVKCSSCHKVLREEDVHKSGTCKICQRDRDWAKRHNLTPEEYKELYNKQDGFCAICGMIRLKPYIGAYLCVDHDHTTGKIRGLLCHACNQVLGKMEDNPILLHKAAEYLENNR